MPRRRFGGLLSRGTDRHDLELRQRAQRRDMRDRGKSPAGARPDDPDADLAARRHAPLHGKTIRSRHPPC